MAAGSTPEENAGNPLHLQDDGHSVGVPTEGKLDGNSLKIRSKQSPNSPPAWRKV